NVLQRLLALFGGDDQLLDGADVLIRGRRRLGEGGGSEGGQGERRSADRKQRPAGGGSVRHEGPPGPAGKPPSASVVVSEWARGGAHAPDPQTGLPAASTGGRWLSTSFSQTVANIPHFGNKS